jgi:hypothetical protein
MTKPMNDPFADPSEGDFFGKAAKASVEGALLAFEVKEFNPNKPTVNSRPDKPTPMVVASVYVLDGEHTGKSWENSEIYGGVVSQLKDRVGQIVLGRWVRGKPNPKFPDNAPWSIQKATAEERQIGMKWYAEHTKPADPFAA